MYDDCLVEIKVDKATKSDVTRLYENLGLDLSTAVRIFLKKSIAVGGLPFELRNEVNNRWSVYQNARSYIQSNDIPEMSLDEINEEIAAVRASGVLR